MKTPNVTSILFWQCFDELKFMVEVHSFMTGYEKLMSVLDADHQLHNLNPIWWTKITGKELDKKMR